MELPFTVVFEPPSQSELRALLRLRRTWLAGLLVVLAIGTTGVVAGVGHADAVAATPSIPLDVGSRPPGAGVWLDGREQGHTPLEVMVQPGAHTVLLKASNAMDGQYTLQAGDAPVNLEAVLWRRQPVLTHLRPALPGAVLSNVQVLADGSLGLSIALPPGRQLQAWRFDPRSGAVRPILQDGVGTRVVVAPDGEHVAVVGYDVGPPPSHFDAGGSGSGRASVLWLMPDQHAAPTAGWRAPLAEGEELVDASWSPSADRLLAVTSQLLVGGATRSRVWFVDADGRAGQVALTLPSQIVAGSEVWSPDGEHIAFLAHAGRVNALCLLDLDGGFRYVADLDPSAASPLAFAPASWTTDSQRLAFVAPHQHPPGVAFGWLQPDPQRGLYVAETGDPTPVLVADTDADLATWREDGQLLELGRLGADGALALLLEGGKGGSRQHLVDLPLKPAAGYGAAWDLGHGRVLVASPGATGGVEYWLVTLELEGAP